jgi:hypothetical protein
VAFADNNAFTGAERVELQNTTLAPKDFVVAVSGYGGVTNGTFSVTVARTPYVVSTITAACDDLSAAPDVLGPATTPVLGDNTVSTNQPLPAGFAFSYFGAAVTNFTASSNGFAQLFTSATATGSSTPTNNAIPNGNSPNGTVAALWDDLYPVAGVSRVRAATSGSAPNRVFTVEWMDLAIATDVPVSPGPERLRFQTKLYETTNLVEFHYCSLQVNGGAADQAGGSSATVGLESLAGDNGTRHAFNAAGSVVSGGGLRFSPQP